MTRCDVYKKSKEKYDHLHSDCANLRRRVYLEAGELPAGNKRGKIPEIQTYQDEVFI